MRTTYKVIYVEVTKDRGYKKVSSASDNHSEYWTYSAYMHDAISSYQEKYNRNPSSKWYRKKSRWEKSRIY